MCVIFVKLMNFSKSITSWYSINKRSLPWRETKKPYYIWLSEIILQQTQVKQGLPYYEAFITKYPTVFDLAKAEENEVLKLWQGLGYYSRARNLHFTAKHIVNGLNGEFPSTYKALLQLKGVGDYTASAIASFCFNEVTAVLDGNVYRVLARYFGVFTPINSSKGAKEFRALAQELIDKNKPAVYNQAIMEFGAVQCKPKNPECFSCPLNTSCVAFSTNVVHELPVKIKPAKAKIKHFNFLVFVSQDKKTVLEKRKGKGIWQNLYQFPLLETQEEQTYTAFKKLVESQDYMKNLPFELLLYNKEVIVHKLSHQHLYTKFWIVNVVRLNSEGISISKIQDFPVPMVIENFIESFNF